MKVIYPYCINCGKQFKVPINTQHGFSVSCTYCKTHYVVSQGSDLKRCACGSNLNWKANITFNVSGFVEDLEKQTRESS